MQYNCHIRFRCAGFSRRLVLPDTRHHLRTPSQRIGKSRSEGAINLLGAKPYVRNSFYDTYRSSPSDERLNKPSDSFMVTTTVSPVQRPVSLTPPIQASPFRALPPLPDSPAGLP